MPAQKVRSKSTHVCLYEVRLALAGVDLVIAILIASYDRSFGC